MKKLIFSLSLISLVCLAQTPIFYIRQGVSLNPGNQSITQSTIVDSALTNCPGFMFATNETKIIRWTLPKAIIINTNCIVNFYLLSTNSGDAIAGRIFLSFHTTNGLIYATNTLVLNSSLTPTGTNISLLSLTNIIPLSIINSNIITASVAFQETYVLNQPNINLWLVAGNAYFY